jgi:hypothetical protein
MSNLVIALDFDGTLCHGNLFPSIGKPRMWLIEKAIEWRKRGHKVILWTCREDVLPTDYSPYWSVGDYLTEAVEWCKSHGLEFDAVNMNLTELDNPRAKASRKILADCYIDDKAIIFDDATETMLGIQQETFDF